MKKNLKNPKYMGEYMCVGMIFGMLIGVIFRNIGVFMILGILIGGMIDYNQSGK